MNNIKKHLRPALKWIIAGIATLNLILLFVFNYDIPFINLSGNNKNVSANEEADAASANSETSNPEAASSENTSGNPSDQTSSETPAIQIQVPDGSFSYDGSSSLDLLSGVLVVDAAGNELGDLQIFTSMKPGESRKEKVIEYSVTDENGKRYTAERVLDLGDNYTGPRIEVLGEMPSISDDELADIVTILLSSNQLKADDGFGKDISSAVSASLESEMDDSGNAIVTLTVTNVVNDTYSLDISIPTKLTGPTIKLTTDRVTLKVGETFNFYNYIDYAKDADGSDLSRYINIDGSVDTSTPGEYELVFRCGNPSGERSEPKTLTVVVN